MGHGESNLSVGYLILYLLFAEEHFKCAILLQLCQYPMILPNCSLFACLARPKACCPPRVIYDGLFFLNTQGLLVRCCQEIVFFAFFFLVSGFAGESWLE